MQSRPDEAAPSGARFGNIPAALLLAAGMSVGWHPVPTLGTLAEVLSFAAVAAVLAVANPRLARPTFRSFAFGAAGAVAILLTRTLADPLLPGVDDRLWVGPAVVLGLALVIALARPADDGRAMRTVACAVLVTALVNALVGILQYWQAYALLDPLGRLVYVQHGLVEANGNLAQRNMLATVCLLGIAASIFLSAPAGGAATNAVAARSTSRRALLAVLAVEAVLAYAVALSTSRTPWVIAAVVAVLAAVHYGPRSALRTPTLRRFVLPVVLVLVATPWINGGIAALSGVNLADSTLARLGSEGSIGIRRALYELAAGIISENPLLGTGWRSTPTEMIEAAMRHGGWGNAELPINVHNLFLQLSLELGLLVALPVCAYLLVRAVRRPPATAAGRFAWLGVLVLLVHSQLEFPLWHPGLLLLAVFLLSHLDPVEPSPASGDTPRDSSPRWFGPARLAAACAFLAAALTAAQLVRIAELWARVESGAPPAALAIIPGEVRGIARNPVLTPYARWVEANVPGMPASRRIELLSGVARWLPDAHVLTALRGACLEAGRHRDAAAIEARLFRVFGLRVDQGG